MKYLIVFFIGVFIGQFYIVPILKKKDLPKCQRIEDDVLRLDNRFPNLGVGSCLIGGNPNLITLLPNYSYVFDTINSKRYYHRDYILFRLKNICDIPKYITLEEYEEYEKQYKVK